MTKEIFIVGAGTYGAAIGDLAEECGYSVIGYYDDDLAKVGTSILGKPVLGKLDLTTCLDTKANYAIAIGNNFARVAKSKEILKSEGSLPCLVHPKAEISKYARLGIGCIVHALTYIWTEAVLGDFSIISPNVVIAHHTKLGEGSFVSTGCSIGAGIDIASRVFIGIGATVMTGVKRIGYNTTVGAGSVVIRDIEPESIVAGVPAKLIRNAR